jgi:hypothetical protein
LDAVGNSEREFMNIIVTHLTQKKQILIIFLLRDLCKTNYAVKIPEHLILVKLAAFMITDPQ